MTAAALLPGMPARRSTRLVRVSLSALVLVLVCGALGTALLASPAHARLMPRRHQLLPLNPLVDDSVIPVRHELTMSARGFERRWARQVRELLETRFDVQALPLRAPLTVWTAEGEVIAFEVTTPDGTPAFATRVVVVRDGAPRDRWVFQDGTSLEGPVLARPVRSASVSSKLGPREHPVYRYRKFHAGTDYTAPVGTPVYAIADGKVIFSGHALTAGNYVVIEHEAPGYDGLESRYLHLHRIARGVKIGALVKRGEVIGEVGQTGLATGPHLHFEVRDGWGTPLDPMSITWPGLERLDTPEVLRTVAIRRALLETYKPGGGRDLFARILVPPGDVDSAPERVEIRGAFAIPFTPPRPTGRRARLVEQPSRRRRRAPPARDSLLAA